MSRTTSRQELMNTWAPWVRFQIPSDLEAQDYRDNLKELLLQFITFSSAKNRYRKVYINPENGGEGGIDSFYIKDELFHGCKLQSYDGKGFRSIRDWKCIIFCDHEDKRSQVEPIFRLADHLEQFLRGRQIPYERFGMLLKDKEEVIQQVRTS